MLHRTKAIVVVAACVVLIGCKLDFGSGPPTVYDCTGVEKELASTFNACVKEDNLPSSCTRETKKLLCKKIPQQNIWMTEPSTSKSPMPLLSSPATPGE